MKMNAHIHSLQSEPFGHTWGGGDYCTRTLGVDEFLFGPVTGSDGLLPVSRWGHGLKRLKSWSWRTLEAGEKIRSSQERSKVEGVRNKESLIFPPPWTGSPTSAGRTPWPRRRWSAGRGSVWQWGPCHPCRCAAPEGTSRHSSPSPWCPSAAPRPGPPPGRRGRSSSPWRRPAPRSTRSRPGCPERCRGRTGMLFNFIFWELNSVATWQLESWNCYIVLDSLLTSCCMIVTYG